MSADRVARGKRRRTVTQRSRREEHRGRREKPKVKSRRVKKYKTEKGFLGLEGPS
jgi:hypothetical protein